MAFRVGQKVVCVRGPLRGNTITQPIVGRVYTVRGTYLSWREGLPAVLLEEIHNRIHRGSGKECGFYASRFRPVVERKTDISIFTAMLTDKRQPVALGEE